MCHIRPRGQRVYCVVKFLRMGANITIRRAGAHDAYETAAVFLAARRSLGFLPELHDDEDTRAFVAGFIAEGGTWLALGDGGVHGLASIGGDWLDHLYVQPRWHSRGIGSALLDHVKQERPEGFQLWTFQVNAGARRFYERHGCVAAEFTDGSRNEERLPDVRYVWRG